MDLLDAAVAFLNADCCVIPARTDGSKAPAVKWEQYQIDLPDYEQLAYWFDGHFGPRQHDGFGIVCGAVSGGLEMLELEGRALHLAVRLAEHLADNGAAELWNRLTSGYLERTPAGGIHLLYRVTGGPAKRNTKLARRPATPDELAVNPADKIKVLIETRGEGGFVITAPSAGRTHPSGQPWTMLAGEPGTIPTITADERDLLYAVASWLDEMPAADFPTGGKSDSQKVAPADGELRPGDDYNQRASWDDILGPAGWKRTRKNFAGTGAAWTRPGKEHGVSATTGTASDGVDRLYVFSTSTDFEAEKPYSKFAAYAVLHCDGDLPTAASQLRRDGYGSPLEEPRDKLTFTGAPTLGAPDGTGGGNDGQSPASPMSPPPRPPGSITVTGGPAFYSLTDDGNALRLVDTHHDTVRFCPQRGQWLRWNGHRWLWDDAETVRELAREIARNLPADNPPRKRWAYKSLSANAITSMVRLARTDARSIAPIDQLDAYPYQLNTPGGIVDLRTGRLIAADPAAMHTRSTACAPDWELTAPRWQRFLAETFAGDPDLTTYVQRLLGLSLIGEVLEQVLPFAYGLGANGKTTLLNTVQRIAGIGDDGYAISAPAEILLATRNTDHPATIAQLSGARLVITSELEEGQQFAEARVKQLTGSDPINARFMARNPFTFVPTHTLWLLANHRPNVKAGGPAFWRRIALLPFMHTVPAEQRDPHLEDHLVDSEGPAILAWCIDGCRDYLADGLTPPRSVKEANEAYQLEQDTITRFVLDMCETGSHTDQYYRIKVAELRSEYEAWCHYEGETPSSRKTFTQGLRTLFGVYSERTSQARWYAGIRLKEVSSNLSSGNDDDSSDDGQSPWHDRWGDR